MKHALLADATDLNAWADRRDSQGNLPRLVRRLIQATVDRASQLVVPGGEGVSVGGWDGVVEVSRGNAHVPEGKSVWEMGVNKKKKEKADGDYEKRTNDPKGVVPGETTYVCVMPRRWGGKDNWLEERNGEGIWKEVRAYDADDLEGWLDTAPAVHAWISLLLGKCQEGALDLETHWLEWAKGTQPTVSPELVLAGRRSVAERIVQWLGGDKDPLALKGDSRQEAIAVLGAVLQQLPAHERGHHLSRSVLVDDLVTWNQVAASGNPLLLVRNFESPEGMVRATDQGHRVIIPLGASDSASVNTIEIPRLSSDEASEALIEMGAPRLQARELASHARRGFTSFRRRLAVNPEVQQPEWAKPKDALSLCPAMLAGIWEDRGEGDRATLATLADTSYSEVGSTLTRWWNESDAPFYLASDKWIITSKEDAWSLLARYLTSDLLERFKQVCVDVLGEPDPRFDLPIGQRPFASIRGAVPSSSDLLKEGLADSLAIMGARETTLGTGDLSSHCARGVVRLVLGRANADWRVWASLSGLLPLLAEAAPDEFLSAAEESVDGRGDGLTRLLAEETESIFGASPHTGLLWALETLAWAPDYLSRASLLLAKLAAKDPGGRSANRPANSLRDIFLPLCPQTAAVLDQRLAVLDMLRKREAETAWRLMESILPKNRGTAWSNHVPRWRDWAPESERQPTPDTLVLSSKAVVLRMVADAGDDGGRWNDIVLALGELPPGDHDTVVETLEGMDSGGLLPETRSQIWNAIRQMVSKHRSYPSAWWALSQEQVERLSRLLSRFEPEQQAARFGWLFAHRPSLVEGREGDPATHREAVRSAQLEAVEHIHAESGLEGLLGLSEVVALPYLLGETAGRAGLSLESEDEFLAGYLDLGDAPRAQFSLGYGVARAREAGQAWVETMLQAREWPASQQAALLICLPAARDTFDLARELGEEAERAYWAVLNPWWVDASDVQEVGGNLIRHGRPRACLTLLSNASDIPVDADLVARGLEGAVQSSETWDPDSYDVGRLLDRLADAQIDESRLASLEWAYVHALRGNRPPRLLHKELSKNPQFFAEIVGLVFAAEGEDVVDVSETDEAKAKSGYEILSSWREIPGNVSGGIDGGILGEWVRSARAALVESKRSGIGDYVIGQTFSGSPVGKDGAWPAEEVRDEIEVAASSDLERGIQIGEFNSRGIQYRDPAGGGRPERLQAERFARDASQIRDQWPRTAAMLDRMATSYRQDARAEDQRSDLREDLGW